jgi:cytoskeletal protein RodZ
MAYSALPQSTQEIIPVSPRAGASPMRRQPTSLVTSPRPARNAYAWETSTKATSRLLRFLILLVVISGLTCLYVWQANTISSINGETQAMTEEIGALERQNVSMMLEYTRWDAPGYIEAESSKSGMVVGPAPVRVQLPGVSEHQAAVGSSAENSTLIRQLAAWLPGSLAFGLQTK